MSQYSHPCMHMASINFEFKKTYSHGTSYTPSKSNLKLE